MTALTYDKESVKTPLTPTGARKLLNQIKRSVENLSDLILSAWKQEAWKVAGYANWDACCEAEFPELKIAYEQRLRVVGELADSGMSDRAIAVALRVSQPTVSKMRPSRDNYLSRDEAVDRKVTGRDGKKYGSRYIPAAVTTSYVHDLSQRGYTMLQLTEETGVHASTLSRLKNGRAKTVSTADAIAVKTFYTKVFGTGRISFPVLDEPVADVIPIQKKTGPQMNAARAEARHCLVNAAITLQKAARQISLVDPEYLRFGESDQELRQAPRIIAESIKSINQSMKGISSNDQPTSR